MLAITRIAAVAVALAVLVAAFAPAAARHAAAQEDCSSTIDLMIVVDGSESINWAEWGIMKAFINDLVGSFTISADDGHAGVVQFASEGQGRVEVGLSGDLATIQGGVAAMTQIIGVTDIQEGIALGQLQLTNFGRPGVPHVIVLLTDGEHNQPGDPYAEAAQARSLGTEIFAVGIGDGPKLEQLYSIVSQPGDSHVFSVNDFNSLVTILQPLVEIVCPPEPEPTPPGEPTDEPPADPPASFPGDGNYTSEPLGVTQLPATGSGLPGDWRSRAGWLTIEALAGVSAALMLIGASYVFTRRRQ